jgi:hypothetical protein
MKKRYNAANIDGHNPTLLAFGQTPRASKERALPKLGNDSHQLKSGPTFLPKVD